MVNIFWRLDRRDYDNELVLCVRIQDGCGNHKVTNGDMLDTVINYIAPKIRKGETCSETFVPLEMGK